MLRPLLAMGLVVTLAACASEPRREVRGRRGGPTREGALGAEMRFSRLFISPSGEPFRGSGGLERWFAQADADHDGAITPAEFKADAVRFFTRLDVSHDSVLDGFEVQAYERDIAPEIAENDFDRLQASGDRPAGGPRGMGGGRGRRRGGGMGPRGGGAAGDGPGRGAGREGAARYSLINEPEPVAGADADVDGKVTLGEWTAAAARRFAALDKAKTGRLTLADLKGQAPQTPPRR